MKLAPMTLEEFCRKSKFYIQWHVYNAHVQWRKVLIGGYVNYLVLGQIIVFDQHKPYFKYLHISNLYTSLPKLRDTCIILKIPHHVCDLLICDNTFTHFKLPPYVCDLPTSDYAFTLSVCVFLLIIQILG